MATLPRKQNLTLVDIASSLDPNGRVAVVAELLNQSNELLSHLPWKEGNLPTGHRGTVRTALPSVTLRRYYQGVKISKSGRATVEDRCAMAEGRFEIDVDVANLNGNSREYRLSESVAFTEAINQAFTRQMLYGDTSVEPDGVLGLVPRYNSLAGQSGENILNAGGTGNDNTSLWLLCLGDNTIHGIFPKGSKAGLEHKDLGEYDALDENNDPYRVIGDLWKWKFGLHVRDWRYAVRIANIDVSDLVSQSGTQAATAATWVLKLMVRALARIPSMGNGTPIFIANRTVKEMLSIHALDRSQNVLAFSAGLDQFGHVAPGSVAGSGTGIKGGQLLFQGVPVLTVDQILSTEARVQ